MKPVALDGTGACHEVEPLFNYEHKQSDLDEPCLSRMGWKTNQAWGKTCGRCMWNVAQLAGDPVSQSEGISPGCRCPFTVLLSWKKTKTHTWGIVMQETPQNPRSSVQGLCIFQQWCLWSKLHGLSKCLRQSSVRWKGYFCPRALLTIHVCFAREGWWNTRTALPCPLNK